MIMTIITMPMIIVTMIIMTMVIMTMIIMMTIRTSWGTLLSILLPAPTMFLLSHFSSGDP